MADLSTPTCAKCRWGKRATDGDDGLSIGLMVQSGGWNGVDIGGTRYPAIGAMHCEHEQRPRGLVLNTYACRDFARPVDIDAQQALPERRTVTLAPSAARAQGYTGDSCANCGSTRMRVAGHCTVCDECGTTTGCS